MKTLERTVRVDKPLDRVYDYLVDFARYLEPLLTLPLKRLGDDAEDSLRLALQRL